jgi:preprotein translocase subunit SecA
MYRKVIASVTYQSLFRQFSRLSGMTGTAMSDAAEFEVIYGLQVTPIPTALPVARRDYPDLVYKTRKAANDALIREVEAAIGKACDGRPCLIGTTSVAMSEALVKELNAHGIDAELLNASPKNALRESEIIAQAGRAGKVTVATNMAGRGTDILLGGCPNTMAKIKARSYLISKGILISPDDELVQSPDENYYPCEISEELTAMLSQAYSTVSRHYGKKISFLELDTLLTVATDTTESDEDPEHVIKLREAIEAIREAYKTILQMEKEVVKNLGGLYVIGTNRHESSRIDNQLRGRAGRQGDPGTSRFFLSFEDDMLVIFGADKFKGILNLFRVSEDMPIEAEQVTKTIDQVQRAVEDKYREVRSELLKFSEVLNNQRMVIYNRRQSILFGTPEQTLERFKKYIKETIAEIVTAQVAKEGNKNQQINLAKVLEKYGQFFPLAAPYVSMENLTGLDEEGIRNILCAAVDETFELKQKEVDATSPSKFAKTANYIMLLTMDNAWTDHLQDMEYIKEGVILRKYQGLDPVAEYRNDALSLFERMQGTMRRNAVYSFWQNMASTISKQPQTV